MLARDGGQSIFDVIGRSETFGIMAQAYVAKGYLRSILGHDEVVELLVRQHWFVLLAHIFLPLLAGIAIFAGVSAASLVWLPDDPRITLGYALLLPVLIILLWRYMVWHNRCYVMTSRRVIQLSGVFSKEVSDSLLEKLNDVKTEQSFLGRIFGYGDIVILTASEAGVNSLHMIAQPLAFKRAMLDAKEALERPQADVHAGSGLPSQAGDQDA